MAFNDFMKVPFSFPSVPEEDERYAFKLTLFQYKPPRSRLMAFNESNFTILHPNPVAYVFRSHKWVPTWMRGKENVFVAGDDIFYPQACMMAYRYLEKLQSRLNAPLKEQHDNPATI